MSLALAQAEIARAHNDVPVGCVIVREGEVVAVGRNRREEISDATAHAEIEAIRAASQALGRWRLSDCALYVTLEPCAMCAGAILNARVGTLVYGARDAVSGACGSVVDLFAEPLGGPPTAKSRPRVYAGVLERECAGILREFFVQLR